MNLELKIPPAAVAIGFGIIMWALQQWLPMYWPRGGLWFWPAVVTASAGVVMGILGLLEFYRHATTINPHKPAKASSLVDSGVYRLSRNPMYLALACVLLSWGFYLGSAASLLLIPLFVWYMNRFQIIPEERIMIEKFGDAYRRYQSAVRRWI
ncbi:methyltransferase family protein [Fodinibius sediminis]|uniref:Protein-S-isoprenylcysteine O-methyltransferase Ste14 n=1 Tax=Fodinibius sediminis TaxID=1214077 RepID=A0A521CM87_9BACT|nr:isoprenylcysteine carboxylmethyltransferase family protein [Fodinibius sediminis]SMO60558.1 Protein-S-isoprenylcysteine O-methyltransferase Ste14 [Fodinibius sediminis]